MSNPFEALLTEETTTAELPILHSSINPFDSLIDGGKESATFADLIKSYSEGSDMILKKFIPVLKYLEKTLNKENLPDVNSILLRLSGEDNLLRVSEYIDQLTEIASRYEEGKKQEHDTAARETQRVKDDLAEAKSLARRLKVEYMEADKTFRYKGTIIGKVGDKVAVIMAALEGLKLIELEEISKKLGLVYNKDKKNVSYRGVVVGRVGDSEAKIKKTKEVLEVKEVEAKDIAVRLGVIFDETTGIFYLTEDKKINVGKLGDSEEKINRKIEKIKTTEAEPIEDDDYLLFFEELLAGNNSALDYSFQGRVSDLVSNAATLNENQLVDSIVGVWIPFDVQDDEWALYFEEHNVPQEKQRQMKKFFSAMMEDKNFGDFASGDMGEDIDDEAQRILALDDSDDFTINIASLKPKGGDLKFDTRKDALLYLYYNKILFKEVATFMEDILVGGGATLGFLGDLAVGVWENKVALFYLLLGYMGLCTAGTLVRRINVTVVNSTSGHFGFGQYLNEALSSVDPDTSKEAGELKKRKEYIKMLEEKYRGNPEKLKKIASAKKIIRVLDHNIDATETQERRLAQIETELSTKNEKIEGLSKEQNSTRKRLKKEIKALKKEKGKISRDLIRFMEGSFWRKIAKIEGESWFLNSYTDTLLKVVLLNTEGNSISSLEDQAKLAKEVKEDLFDGSGEKRGVLKEAENFIQRSHTVPNDKEADIEKAFNEYVRKLKRGEFGSILGNTKDEMINNIKKDLIAHIRSETGVTLGENIYTEGNSLNNAKDLFFDGFSEFDAPRGSNKRKKWVEAIFEGSGYTDPQLAEIDKFFSEIAKGQNQYNQRTALDICARIIRKNITYKEAISESFLTDWTQIKDINVDSDFKGSLDTLLRLIDGGGYSLNVGPRASGAEIATRNARINSFAGEIGAINDPTALASLRTRYENYCSAQGFNPADPEYDAERAAFDSEYADKLKAIRKNKLTTLKDDMLGIADDDVDGFESKQAEYDAFLDDQRIRADTEYDAERAAFDEAYTAKETEINDNIASERATASSGDSAQTEEEGPNKGPDERLRNEIQRVNDDMGDFIKRIEGCDNTVQLTSLYEETIRYARDNEYLSDSKGKRTKANTIPRIKQLSEEFLSLYAAQEKSIQTRTSGDAKSRPNETKKSSSTEEAVSTEGPGTHTPSQEEISRMEEERGRLGDYLKWAQEAESSEQLESYKQGFERELNNSILDNIEKGELLARFNYESSKRQTQIDELSKKGGPDEGGKGKETSRGGGEKETTTSNLTDPEELRARGHQMATKIELELKLAGIEIDSRALKSTITRAARQEVPPTKIDEIIKVIEIHLTVDKGINISSIDLNNLRSYQDILTELSGKRFSDSTLQSRVKAVLGEYRSGKTPRGLERLILEIVSAFKKGHIS